MKNKRKEMLIKTMSPTPKSKLQLCCGLIFPTVFMPSPRYDSIKLNNIIPSFIRIICLEFPPIRLKRLQVSVSDKIALFSSYY